MFTLTFARERATKRMVRYIEDGDGPPTTGLLYVSKAAFATLGNPDKLVVTLYAAAADQSAEMARATE